jgi:hypothetical protein
MPLVPLRRHEARPSPAAAQCCGSFLTDGRRLFRVVSRFGGGASDAFASLEDCLTLEVAAYSRDELCEMGLRPVRTGDGGVE